MGKKRMFVQRRLSGRDVHGKWSMISRRQPTSSSVGKLLALWDQAPLSYDHRKGVEDPPRSGFIPEDHRVCLGAGSAVFHRARRALDAWTMFPDWAHVYPELAPQKPGQLVAMVVQIFGLWWVNPCRILTRCDSASRYGFVYGTLPEHSECGEERFMVEMLPDGSVWYEIRAFSKPQHWMAWIGFPLARWWQLRFVRDSQAAMKEVVRA